MRRPAGWSSSRASTTCVKGAAGQAVQNFNVAFGFDERTGSARDGAARRWCSKLGGELLESSRRRSRVRSPASIAVAAGRWSSCHGGGKEIDAALERARHREATGRRACASPTPTTLDVVVAVLAGAVNTRLVAALVRQRGVRAVGLTGVDGGLVPSDAGAADITRSTGRCVDLGPRRQRRAASGRPALAAQLLAGRIRAGGRAASRRRPDGLLLQRERRHAGARIWRARLERQRLVIAGGTAGVLDDARRRRSADSTTGGHRAPHRQRRGQRAGMVAKLRRCRTR